MKAMLHSSMFRGNLRCLAALLASMIFGGVGMQAQSASVVPAPLEDVLTAGSLEIGSGAEVVYPAGNAGAKFAAEHLVGLVQQTAGLTLVAHEAGAKASAKGKIFLEASGDPKAARESYELTVGADRITIAAPQAAGLYYGTVTLWQLLTASGKKGAQSLHCEKIHDAPAMVWRGIMLDSARHMQSIAYIHRLIDWMSLEKLNTLHWHLTDDQAWRLEIKRYPKLTAVGGWRELPSEVGQIDPKTGKSYPKYGGFYTQEQVRELVAYAAARNVMIVPEIEMPGHATAVLSAYPEYGSSDEKLTGPTNKFGIFPSIYNVDDKTFEFLENILTEVMALFPSPYIHVGGDEALKDEWKASAKIQAQMKALGVGTEDELQSYFIKRIDTFLTAHQKRTIGWDEILQGGLASNAAVMSWHGVKGAIDAATQGHDAVLTPVNPLYLNYRQSDAANEAPGRAAIHTLKDVYSFDPQPATLTADQRQHILGVQGNIWSEYLITEDRVTWMLFPRTAALAEIGWSAIGKRDWSDFERRMVVEMERYKALGIGFDPNAFQVKSSETLAEGGSSVSVTLKSQTSFGVLRYTTDGSAVTAASAKFDAPIDVKLPGRVRAAAFVDDAAAEPIVGSELDRLLDAQSVRRRYSQETKLCVADPSIGMEQDPLHGDRPVMLANYQKPCWIYQAADLSGISSISAEVATLPYVFQDSKKTQKAPDPGTTAHGELEVHLDSCSGKVIALLPFMGEAKYNVVERVHATLPVMMGSHDLCLKEDRPGFDPLWVLNWVQLDVATK